jgi:hypothetical protein
MRDRDREQNVNIYGYDNSYEEERMRKTFPEKVKLENDEELSSKERQSIFKGRRSNTCKSSGEEGQQSYQ